MIEPTINFTTSYSTSVLTDDQKRQFDKSQEELRSFYIREIEKILLKYSIRDNLLLLICQEDSRRFNYYSTVLETEIVDFYNHDTRYIRTESLQSIARALNTYYFLKEIKE